MLAVVRTPRTKRTQFEVKGDIPHWLMSRLKREYKSNLDIQKDPDEEYVDITKTAWYKKMEKERTPGKAMRIYREMKNWTQQDLGKKLGNVSRHNVSNMENGHRPISKATAIKLSKLYGVSVERFIQ